MVQIGDKGTIRCEVRGFGKLDPRLKLGRTLYVEARGHVIQILEKEFIPDASAAASPEPQHFTPIDHLDI